jgi:exodeoxyribonuclease VII small subunit
MHMEKINYEEAYQELVEIVQRIESGEISIDELSDKVKRASVLLKYCKEKLHNTEKDIDGILQDISEEE